MALLDFPSGPTQDVTTYTSNGNTWKWNGTSWVAFNNLSLSSQVSGILAVQYGGTGFGGTYTTGDILYALSSNTFGKLTAGTAGSVLASGGPSTAPYWKVDELGTGSVGNGTTFGITYYNGLNTVTSGTAFSYIVGPGAGGTGGTVVLTSSTMALVGSTITSGTWAGSAITAKYGGTGLNAIAVGEIIYGSATDTFAKLSAAGGGASVLTQTSGSIPVYFGQSQLVVGGATTSANIHGGTLGNIHYQTGANATSFVTNAAGSGASILTQTGNAAPIFFSQAQLVVGGATTSANIQGGGQGQLVYNSATNTTSFLSHPGAGYALTSVGTGTSVAWQLISNLAVTNNGVTSIVAGTAIGVNQSTGAVTISNNGVTSLTGTANQITASASTGSVTLSLPSTVIVTDIQVTGTNSTLGTVGSSATSMVNKQYVDNLASGLDIHGSVRVVQASSIGASYVQSGAAGTSAVGAFLISTTQVALPAIDGVTISATGASQRVLIAGGATGRTNINGSGFVQTPVNSNIANGIYFVGSLGGAGTSNWILVRATDTDDSVELTAGTFTFIEEGTVYKDTGWACTNDTTNYGPIQFGLDNSNTGAINFSQFTGAAAISFGQGLTQTGNAVATNVNLSSSFAASAIGFTQFNIGGAAGAGAAATGYYPTFSVKTNTIHAGTALLTINHTGFSLVGSTNTAASLTVTGNISLPSPTANGIAYGYDSSTVAFTTAAAGSGASILTQTSGSSPIMLGQSQLVVGGATTSANIQGGALGNVHYQSGANATGFVANAAGSGASILSQTGNAAPLFFGQSQLVVGGATTSANIQGGTQYNVVYQSNVSTTGFVANAAGGGASILTQTGSGAPIYLGQSQLSVGSATNSTNVAVTATTGAGTSYLAIVSGISGNLPILADTNITVDAATNTITATNFSGIASSATRVGITTSISSSDLPIAFADAHQPYAALGSSTLLTYQASTGKITNGIWAGIAITTGRGGTGLITVSPNQILMGASTGNTWAAIGSSLVPVVCVGANPPAEPGGAIGATQAGQLWWDSTYGVLKVFYSDINTSQWVDALPILGSSGGGSSTKRSYVMTFGAGFTPSTGADTVQIQIPYAPDNTSKYYYIKRLDYRNETTSGGSGVTFFIERHTTGSASFSPTFRIHTAGSGVGASFVVGPTTVNTSYTLAATGASFVSSSGIAASVISGDYLRLNFTALGTAATLSVSMVIEEQ